MVKLPPLSGRQVVDAFKRLGWHYRHHTGSHMILDKSGAFFKLSIPDRKEVSVGLLRDQIRKAGLTEEEFMAVVKR